MLLSEYIFSVTERGTFITVLLIRKHMFTYSTCCSSISNFFVANYLKGQCYEIIIAFYQMLYSTINGSMVQSMVQYNQWFDN